MTSSDITSAIRERARISPPCSVFMVLRAGHDAAMKPITLRSRTKPRDASGDRASTRTLTAKTSAVHQSNWNGQYSTDLKNLFPSCSFRGTGSGSRNQMFVVRDVIQRKRAGYQPARIAGEGFEPPTF